MQPNEQQPVPFLENETSRQEDCLTKALFICASRFLSYLVESNFDVSSQLQCYEMSCATARKVLNSLLEKEQRISACLILAQTFLLQDWMNPTKKSCTEVKQLSALCGLFKTAPN